MDGQDLGTVDTVGSSMGARMVLELARRGRGGHAVALDPGGFWNDAELRFFSVPHCYDPARLGDRRRIGVLSPS